MVYMYHSFLIHSSADGHLGCYHVLAIINSAAMNIGVHVSLSDLVSSVCMPRSGIAGSYFQFFKNQNCWLPSVREKKAASTAVAFFLLEVSLSVLDGGGDRLSTGAFLL